MGIINVVCGFIIVYKIGLFIFGECNNYKYANRIWIVFPCVIRKTKWDALLSYFFSVCGGHFIMWNLFSTKEGGEWVLGTTRVSITTQNPPPTNIN